MATKRHKKQMWETRLNHTNFEGGIQTRADSMHSYRTSLMLSQMAMSNKISLSHKTLAVTY